MKTQEVSLHKLTCVGGHRLGALVAYLTLGFGWYHAYLFFNGVKNIYNNYLFTKYRIIYLNMQIDGPVFNIFVWDRIDL